MQLLNLKSLHIAMAARGYTRAQFKVEVSGKQVLVLFVAEGAPYLMGLIIDNTVVTVPVLNGYQINPVLPYQDYSRLSLALGKNHKAGDTFYSGAFFKELDQKIPTEPASGMFVPPWLALMLFPNVDEPKKHWFMGFQKNGADAPSDHNLEKTKLLLGEEAYKICKAQGLSSRWSDDSARAVKVVPELAKIRANAQAPSVVVQSHALAEPKYVSKLGILCGAPGTGKSTLSRELQRKIPEMVVLDLDVFTDPLVTQMMAEAGIPLSELPKREKLYNQVLEAQYASLSALAHDLLSQGHYPLCVASFNQNLSNPKLFLDLADALKKTGVELKLSVLTTSADEAKRRISDRGDHWDALRLKNWDKTLKEYAPPTLPASLKAFVADTTDYSRAQLIFKLASFFKS